MTEATPTFDPTQFDTNTQSFLDRHESRNIKRGIVLFQQFYNASIYDFLISVDEDNRQSLRTRKHIMKNTLQKFANYLSGEAPKQTRPWTGKTIGCYFSAVTAYLGEFLEIKVSTKGLNLPSEHVTFEKHPWAISEFTPFVNSMSLLKYQALTVCLFQSGLSLSDLLGRKYGHVKKELQSQVCPLCLAPENEHIYRHKKVGRNKHVKFLSFIAQSGIELLKAYLASRGPLNDDDPLFDVDAGRAEEFVARHAKKLYGPYIGMNPWRLHGLRDFFKKRALLSPLRSREGECYIEYLSAHDLDADIEKRYNSMTREEWRNIYREIQPFLEITIIKSET